MNLADMFGGMSVLLYELFSGMMAIYKIYSTTKETHQSHFKASMVKCLRIQNIFDTIFFNNQLCIKLLNNVTV